AETSTEGVSRTTGPQTRRFAWASGMVAASAAVLLFSMMFFPGRNGEMPATISQLPPDYAWLRNDQLQTKSTLLAAMEETFDGHFNWLAETGDHVQLALAASTSSVDVKTDDDVRMAVRIV